MDDVLTIETRLPEELQALKVERYEQGSTCEACYKPIDTLEESALLTKVLHSPRSDATLLVHSKCLGLAFTRIANRAVRMRNLR